MYVNVFSLDYDCNKFKTLCVEFYILCVHIMLLQFYEMPNQLNLKNILFDFNVELYSKQYKTCI